MHDYRFAITILTIIFIYVSSFASVCVYVQLFVSILQISNYNMFSASEYFSFLKRVYKTLSSET